MVHKTINLSPRAEEVWKKKFDSKLGKSNFSEWVSEQLIDLKELKYDLNTLIEKRTLLEKGLNLKEKNIESLQNKILEIKEEYSKDLNLIKEFKDKIEIAKKLEELKFKLNEREAKFLNDTNELISIDSSKLYPRLRFYCTEFSKDVNEEEFFKLLKIAETDFPEEFGYLPKDLNNENGLG